MDESDCNSDSQQAIEKAFNKRQDQLLFEEMVEVGKNVVEDSEDDMAAIAEKLLLDA